MATVDKLRTAIVVVHGMGEQLPLETLNRFVRTALPRVDGERRYFSRPERVTDSYEARRHLSYRQPFTGPQVHGQVEFFEYHWSYLMTGNKLGDLLPTLRRLLVRRPSRVPYGLRKVWWLAWLVIVALLAALVATLLAGVKIDEFSLAGVLAALFGQGLIAAGLLQLLNRAGNAVTKSFVDVVRYLDRSPRSYEARRAIRKGMVDLLQGLHSKGRYSRVIVVAHSLGAYIAYDAIAYLWPEMSKLHGGPLSTSGYLSLPELAGLEAAAALLVEHPSDGLDDDQQAELEDFRTRQLMVWKELRRQGNPWLVTDFVTVGTPMYFADLLYAKDPESFRDLVRRAELPICPPRGSSQTVEGPDAVLRYGFNNQGREVLAHGAPFAVVRWSNLFFPAERSWFGDWFGGPLRPLFGNGILDQPVLGNLPGRRTPGLAHSRYFSYPDDTGENDVATLLRRLFRFDLDESLTDLMDTPDYLPETDITR